MFLPDLNKVAIRYGRWTIERRTVGRDDIVLYISASEDMSIDFDWTGEHMVSLSEILREGNDKMNSAFIVDLRMINAEEENKLLEVSIALLLRGTFTKGIRNRWLIFVCEEGCGIAGRLLKIKQGLLLQNFFVHTAFPCGRIYDDGENVDDIVKRSLILFSDCLGLNPMIPGLRVVSSSGAVTGDMEEGSGFERVKGKWRPRK